MRLKLLSLAIGVLCFIAIGIYAIWLSVPLMLAGVVRLVPVSFEDRLGRAVVAGMARPGTTCEDPATKDLISAVSSRLQTAMPNSPYRFNVQVVRNPEVNALAAPGGHIVIFSGLIERMQTADQLAAVLAHEMQHVVQRHSMKGMVRSLGLRLLVLAVVGDPGIFGDLAGNLTVLHFMRSDEQSADDEALSTLMRAGIPPSEMQKAFTNLAKSASDEPEITALKYLSSHPPLSERIERIRARVGEWNAVARPIAASTAIACRP